jgi:galactose mutarotase-like enzyme
LRDGEYRFDGRSYSMPKHGFARHSAFELAEKTSGRAVLRLEATAETRAIYPFHFALDLDFAVDGRTLTMRATIANRGGVPMPASFGFHPALRWPLPFGEPRDAHRIVFAQEEPSPIRRIDADGLLTPDPLPTPVVGDTLVLRDDLFEDDALIFDRLASRSLRYGAASDSQLQVDFQDFPTLGVWTKAGAHYVCIEPWHGSADPVGFAGDIREKPGIFEVAPGEVRSLAMQITLAD